MREITETMEQRGREINVRGLTREANRARMLRQATEAELAAELARRRARGAEEPSDGELRQG